MKVATHSLSKRAEDIIKSPRFLLESIPEGKKKGETGSIFLVTGSDKILTVKHYTPSSQIEFLFAEVLCLFSSGKTLEETWKISYREVDSFLRDENHLPFAADLAEKGEEIFVQTKLSLMAAFFKEAHKEQFSLWQKGVLGWQELSLVEKNRWALEVTSALSWDLVLCERESLVVDKVFPGLSPEALSFFMDELFAFRSNIPPMKVVAV